MSQRNDHLVLSKMFSASTAASFAELVTIPFDTAKVRLQIQGEHQKTITGNVTPKYRGMIHTIVTMAKQEGPLSVFKGLSAGVQRQICFCGIRIGLYDTVRNFYGDTKDGRPQVMVKILASCTTASMAVLLFQPTEVVKIRFQASQLIHPYSSSLNAYGLIGRVEGVKGLWRGMSTNMIRLSVVNCTEIVTYDLIKSWILYKQLFSDGMPLHFMSATGAGFVTTVIASPIDVVKTRFTNSPAGSYKTPLHCAYEMAKENGMRAFYKGFIPSFIRLSSWSIVMFVSYEQMKRLTGSN